MSNGQGSDRKGTQQPIVRTSDDQQGLGGLIGAVLIQPRFATGDPRNSVPVGGTRGRYRVIVSLRRPGASPVPENHISLVEGVEGDSHIRIAARLPAAAPRVASMKIDAQIGDERGQFLAFPNREGFLSHLVVELDAHNLKAAEVLAVRSIAPFLSACSVRLDVPAVVWRVLARDLASGQASVLTAMPFDEPILVPTGGFGLSQEFRTLASFYREALGSQSPAYEFLCLFKTIEAINEMRRRRTSEAVAAGRTPTSHGERLPRSDADLRRWLTDLFPAGKRWSDQFVPGLIEPQFRGRKVNEVVDKTLRPLRVHVAHGLWGEGGGGTLVLDDALHLQRVTSLLPMTRLIVRRLLRNDFPEEFGESGTSGSRP